VLRRIVGLGTLIGCGAGVAAIALAPSVTGCQTHQCDATSVDEGAIARYPGANNVIGTATIYGGMLHWASSPIDGPWLAFNASSQLSFEFPPTLPEPYSCFPWPAGFGPTAMVSPVDNCPVGAPEVPGAISTGSGQDFAWAFLPASSDAGEPGGFVVSNGSCQCYLIRVEEWFALPDTACASSADSGPSDDSSD
jgi:hypothetical protein